MISVAAPSAHVFRYHLRPIPPPLGRCPPHCRRRLLFTARATAQRGDDAAPEVTSSKPASAFQLLSNKDYSHTLFHSECLEVLGLVDLESLRKRPRLTVGLTVKASVVLPVLVVLAVLYLTDMAKGVVDWTHHHHTEPEGEDVGD